MQSVGYAAFWNVKGMTKYSFSENVEDLDGCLYNCGTLDLVTLRSTPAETAFGFQPGDVIEGSTVASRLVIDDPDGVVGRENKVATSDNIVDLTMNVAKIEGSLNMEDLESLTVTGAESISDYWLYDRAWQQSTVPNLKSVTLQGVGIIGKYAFEKAPALVSVTLKNVSVVGEGGFYYCPALSGVTIENVGLIDAYVFSGCTSLQGLEVPEETKLGYSDIFDFTKPGFAALKDRMLGILDGRFELEENPAPDELTVPAGWTDFELGAQNEAALDKTQVTKAARWADDARTQADVEFQFNYAKTQGMDFLFVVDYSGSMAKVGNYADGTQPDDSVDDNSRFCDMQSKLLDVSEKLLGAEGYDNRVAFVTFATGLERTLDFTDTYSAVEQFVTGDYPYGSTNYSQALARRAT